MLLGALMTVGCGAYSASVQSCVMPHWEESDSRLDTLLLGVEEVVFGFAQNERADLAVRQSRLGLGE
jgi:hypothetical protein